MSYSFSRWVALLTATVDADVFTADEHEFEIEFVTIGIPGNAPDTTGDPNPAGAVDYTYRMAKYEFTRGDAYEVFRAGELGTLGEHFEDYSFLAEQPADFPAGGMSWNNAARIVNWLNESKGFPHAYNYKFQPGETRYSHNAPVMKWEPDDPGYDEGNLLRNSLARYFLPTEDEWYKAAYFDPEMNKYWDYPTGSDTPPVSVLSGTDPNTALFGHSPGTLLGPVTQAGGLSAYGVMGMGGNASEWNEAELLNNPADGLPPVSRGERGCSLSCTVQGLSSSHQSFFWQEFQSPILAFRVASVPGPSAADVWAWVIACVVAFRRRR